MAKVTWLGDEDPSAQHITLYGHEFVKGVPTDVDDKHEKLEKLKTNPSFSTDAKAEPVDSIEPPAPDPDEGSEKAYLRSELERMGQKPGPNSSVETMRKKLAETLAK